MGVGGGGMGGYIPPTPRTLHTSGQNWLGGYGNFFHVVKIISEKTGDLFSSVETHKLAASVFYPRAARCILYPLYPPGAHLWTGPVLIMTSGYYDMSKLVNYYSDVRVRS